MVLTARTMPAAPTTFADLQGFVDDLAGLEGKLSSDGTERDQLINESNVELCTQSGWSRDTLTIATSVAEQETYAFPSEWRKPADDVVEVGSLEYRAADPASKRRAVRGELDLEADGIWWIAHESAVAKLGIYPVPAAESEIKMLSVVTPPILDGDDDEPPVPWDFRMAIVHRVRAIALGFSEDDVEGAAAGFAEFERQVQRLTALRVERESGDGVMQVQIAGVHY